MPRLRLGRLRVVWRRSRLLGASGNTAPPPQAPARQRPRGIVEINLDGPATGWDRSRDTDLSRRAWSEEGDPQLAWAGFPRQFQPPFCAVNP